MRLPNLLVLLCGATSFPLLGQVTNRDYPCVCDATTCGQKNWLDIGYTGYWIEGFDTPALVSQSPAGTDRSDAGVLGLPTTSVTRSGSLSDNHLSGIRVSGGHAIDGCGVYSVTGSLLWAGANSSEDISGNADSIFARPFFNSDPSVNAQDAELVSFPGVVDGSVGIASDTDVFSAGIGLQRRISCCADPCCCPGKRIDLFLGYRAFVIDEELEISEQLQPLGGLFDPGTLIDITDSFQARNSFQGIEFGVLTSFQRQRWEFDVNTRVALGNIRQRVTIAGSTVTTVPGAIAATHPCGFLAAPSNIGTHTRDRFGVFTDTQLRIGYWLSRRAKAYVGYNLLFLSSVTRPGGAMDTRLNPTQIDPNQPTVGPAEPSFNWSDESLLLHGINAGIEFRF